MVVRIFRGKFLKVTGRNKRIQQSCVCLWVETVNTSNTGVYRAGLKRNGQTTGVFDAVRRRKATWGCESRRMIGVCRTGYHLHTRSSVCHSWHHSKAETEKSDAALNIINKTDAGSALLPHWFTGAANHNLRPPHRLPPPPPRLFLNQPVCQTLTTHACRIETDYQTVNMAVQRLFPVATPGIAAKILRAQKAIIPLTAILKMT